MTETDEIKEIRIRVAKLHRQAERFGQMTVDQLRDMVEEKEALIDTRDARIKELKKQCLNCGGSILFANLSDEQKKVRELEEENATLKAEVRKAQDEAADLRRELTNAKALIETLKASVNLAEENWNKAEAEVERLTEKANSCSATADQAIDRLAKAANERDEANELLVQVGEALEFDQDAHPEMLVERAKQLIRLDNNRCEHCGAKLSHYSHGCPLCGAPVCCQQCCKIEHYKAEVERLVNELDASRKLNNIHKAMWLNAENEIDGFPKESDYATTYDFLKAQKDWLQKREQEKICANCADLTRLRGKMEGIREVYEKWKDCEIGAPVVMPLPFYDFWEAIKQAQEE